MKKIRFFVNTVLLIAATLLFATNVFADADLQAAAASEETDTSEELLQGYFDEVFLENCVIESPKDVPTLKAANRKAAMRRALSSPNQVIYDTIKVGVIKIAEGKASKAVFSVKSSAILEAAGFTASDWQQIMSEKTESKKVSAFRTKFLKKIQINDIFSALLVDLPYELYWFDKCYEYPEDEPAAFVPIVNTSFKRHNAQKFYFEDDDTIDFYMQVAEEFRSDRDPVSLSYGENGKTPMYLYTDVEKTAVPKQAAENAAKQQRLNVGKTDLEKLTAYKNYICDAVSYNNELNSSTPYGNPWQMIWVFDEDFGTNVVCEGYAKAFQYLCDRSSFSEPCVKSRLASGYIPGGAHMWNIVTMENGKNYLVDLTNSDNKPNTNDLFLRGGIKKSLSELKCTQGIWGHRVNKASSGTLDYSYDQETIDTYNTSELLLADTYYSDNTVHAESVSITGAKTIYAGDKLELSAEVLPSDTSHKGVKWSSSNTSIASVSADGIVSAKKKGSVKVTVTTMDSDRTASVTIKILQHATGIEIRSGSTAVSGETTLYVGDKALSLSAVVTPSNAESLDYHWTISGDESSAQIVKTSAGYTITAKKDGVLTVKAISDESPSVSKTLKIRMLTKKVPVTPEKQAENGTSFEKASVAIVSGGEESLVGSSFRPLKARVYKTKKNSVTIRWNKVSGASAYVIFGNRCGKSRKFKKLAEVKASQWKWTYKNLKKGRAYKFIVMAVKGNGTARTVLTTSKTVHAYTAGGTYSNYKSIKPNKKSVTLKTGKTFKLKVTAVSKGGKIKIHRKICYESSNTDIATVSSKGKIKAKAAGTCYVFAYAQDGTYKSIKVKVKNDS